METKIVYDMTHEEYLAYPALSKSGIDNFLISPAHYKYYAENCETPTDAMRFGSMLHMAVLEPKKFLTAYESVAGDGRTKDYKAKIEQLRQQGITPVKETEHLVISNMLDALQKKTRFKQLMTEAKKEVSIFWTEKSENIEIPCKARIDIVTNKNVLADYKTTKSANEIEFSYSIKKYNYDIQSAWYQRGWAAVTGKRPLGFCFIAQEKEPPHGVAFYNIPDLKIANLMIEKVLGDYAQCLDSDIWPSYPDKIIDLYVKR